MTIEELYRAYATELIRRTQRRTDRSTDADDACQNAWEALIRQWDRLQFGAPAEPRAWLTVVARNELYTIHRQRQREDSLHPAALAPRVQGGRPSEPDWVIAARIGGRDDSPKHELRELREAIPRLRTHHRRVGVTVKLIGLSHRQAAQATGRSPTWINRAIVEGKRALRDALA